jgi:hypothetical protein
MKNLISFYKLTSDGLPPQRADRSAAGTLPTKGFRFCEAVTTASAFGWYVFLPIDFSVVWDGTETVWSYDEGKNWYPLHSVQVPDFAPAFDMAAPESVKGFSPPFITKTDDYGILQIWTGVIATTASDWSLLVRSPANLQRSLGYDTMEGLIETDRWFGPLFTNVRLTRTDAPIHFRSDWPFLQVQPIHRSNYADQLLNAVEVKTGLGALSDKDWAKFHKTIVVPNTTKDRCLGGYAVQARKRRACEMLSTR